MAPRKMVSTVSLHAFFFWNKNDTYTENQKELKFLGYIKEDLENMILTVRIDVKRD